MNFLSNISVTELGPLLNLVQESTTIKRHFELFNWLQNQVQRFIPHDILITAWGDFSLGLVCHDIVSPLTGMRTDSFDDKALLPFLGTLFERWDECNNTPYIIRTEDGFYHEQLVSPILTTTIARMRCGGKPFGRGLHRFPRWRRRDRRRPHSLNRVEAGDVFQFGDAEHVVL